MPRVSPFIGLTYNSAVAGSLDQVTAPPYDVIGDVAQRMYLESSPFNIVHLDRKAEGDEWKYRNAAELLTAWRSSGVLVGAPEPSYFAYEMRFRLGGRDRTIRGVLCAMDLEDWGGSVLPHEQVLAGPVEDRLALMRATRANLSPVYGTITGPCEPLAGLLHEVSAAPAPWETADEQGVSHRMWRVDCTSDVSGWIGEATLLIADGHHRYTTALHYRDEMSALEGPGPWDRVLTLIVDAGIEQPPVLPFHRIVSARPATIAGSPVRDLQEVLGELDDDKLIYGSAAVENGRLIHRVAELDGAPPTVMALHESVIDAAAVSRGDVRFTHDAVAAEDAVRGGEAAVAYFLPATTADRILAVVQRGERLPQKSTFFWPKPRTGMILRAFDEITPPAADRAS